MTPKNRSPNIFLPGTGKFGPLTAKQAGALRSRQEFAGEFYNDYNRAVSIFQWDLPEGCDERFLEQALICGPVALCATPGGYIIKATGAATSLNPQGSPLKGWAWTVDGTSEEVTFFIPGAAQDAELLRSTGLDGSLNYTAVYGRDNPSNYPYISYLYLAAEKKSNIRGGMGVCVTGLKQPLWPVVPESMVESVEAAIRDIERNVPAVVAGEALPSNLIKALDTGVKPDNLRALREQYEWEERQLGQIFGIRSGDQLDKAERLLVDEVNASKESTGLSLMARLHCREQFCRDCNEAFGLNMSVRLRGLRGGVNNADDLRGVPGDDEPGGDLYGAELH